MRKALVGFLIYFCFVVSLSSATVFLKQPSVSFPDLPAKFAVYVNNSGTCGALYISDPPDACSSIRKVASSSETKQKRFVLIARGQCTFEDKIRNAQKGGFDAAIVYDDRENSNLVYMMVNPEGIKVHAVFVSNQAGLYLKRHARGERGECCILPPYSGGSWTVLAISLLSLIVIVAFLIIVFLTPRQWLYWRARNNDHPRSVDTKIVEALPCFTFSSARSSHCHGGETCAICLEDYKDGEILKILPCQHEFHSSCVDSWLTKWGTCCPVCKLDMNTKIKCSEVKRGNRHQNQHI